LKDHEVNELVVEKLTFSHTAPAYTEAMEMVGTNAVLVEVTALSLTGNIECSMEQGNDLQNWEPVGGSLSIMTLSTQFLEVAGVAARYARVKLNFALDATGQAVTSIVTVRRRL
jgi:hypothetical protein